MSRASGPLGSVRLARGHHAQGTTVHRGEYAKTALTHTGGRGGQSRGVRLLTRCSAVLQRPAVVLATRPPGLRAGRLPKAETSGEANATRADTIRISRLLV